MMIGRKLRFAAAIACVLALSLTGCGKTGKLDEGDCACVVSLESIPQEFKMLGDNAESQLNIEVTLQNITTERNYHFTLDRENGFKQNASLNPGVYRVYYCTGSPYYLHMDISARQEQLEVTKGGVNELTVYIENLEEFSDIVWDFQPIREVMQLDKFSRKAQWQGQIIDLERITEYIDFEYDQPVKGYEQVTIFDSGVGITVQNQTSEAASWKECKLIKVQVRGTNLVFAQGARVGMSVREIMHAEEGIYGTPDSMTGSLLMGIGLDNTGMVYYDESSGDRFTLECDPAGENICSIVYEFAAYE